MNSRRCVHFILLLLGLADKYLTGESYYKITGISKGDYVIFRAVKSKNEDYQKGQMYLPDNALKEKGARGSLFKGNNDNDLLKSGCFEKEIGYRNVGQLDYGDKPTHNYGITHTAVQCQQLCQIDHKCVQFNWIRDIGCYLKETKAIPFKYPKKRGFMVTGPKLCLGCSIEERTHYYGYNIAKKFLKGAYNCAFWCSITKKCKYWTFRKTDNLCWIKTSDRNKGSDSNTMSGTKYCAKEIPLPNPFTTAAHTPSPTTTPAARITPATTGPEKQVGRDLGVQNKRKELAGNEANEKENDEYGVGSDKGWNEKRIMGIINGYGNTEKQVDTGLRVQNKRKDLASNEANEKEYGEYGVGSGKGWNGKRNMGVINEYSNTGYANENGNIDNGTGNGVGNIGNRNRKGNIGNKYWYGWVSRKN